MKESTLDDFLGDDADRDREVERTDASAERGDESAERGAGSAERRGDSAGNEDGLADREHGSAESARGGGAPGPDPETPDTPADDAGEDGVGVSDDADARNEDERASGEFGADGGTETDRTEGPTVTYASGLERSCASCGTTADRLWRTDEGFVCPACVEW